MSFRPRFLCESLGKKISLILNSFRCRVDTEIRGIAFKKLIFKEMIYIHEIFDSISKLRFYLNLTNGLEPVL